MYWGMLNVKSGMGARLVANGVCVEHEEVETRRETGDIQPQKVSSKGVI